MYVPFYVHALACFQNISEAFTESPTNPKLQFNVQERECHELKDELNRSNDLLRTGNHQVDEVLKRADLKICCKKETPIVPKNPRVQLECDAKGATRLRNAKQPRTNI